MAELLKFKKGTHANLLKQTKVAGTVYVTTDEKAMYVDIDNNTRIRLGQIVNFPTLTAFQTFLNTTIPPYSEEAFYYIEDKNALLKWVGNSGETSVGGIATKGTWTQINSTQAVTEAINGVSNRVSSLESTVNDSNTGLVKKVSTLENTVNNSNTGLVKRVTTNETNIKNLQDAIGMGEGSTTGSIGAAVTQLINDLNTAEEEIDALQSLTAGHTNTIGEHTTQISNLNKALTDYKTEVGNTYATKSQLDNEKKNLQSEIDADILVETNRAKKAEEANTNAISTLQGIVNKLNEADTVEGSVKQQIKAAKEALSAEIDADIRAANAMEYVKGISASTALPTTAKNGATYVAEGAFSLANGTKVFPGDLLIATGIEDTNTGLITTNLTWTIVHTGYDATLEQTLNTVNGKIQLTSKVGGTASEISFEAKQGTSATVAVANNTVTIGIEWDNF